jgi:hypothetical protein
VAAAHNAARPVNLANLVNLRRDAVRHHRNADRLLRPNRVTRTPHLAAEEAAA